MPGGLMAEAEFEKLLGESFKNKGGARQAFNVPSNPYAIVRKVHGKFVGPNVIEWIIWNTVRESKWEKVFGQCHAISPTGTYLMMERLNDLSEAMRPNLPKLPDWVRDVWANNFGVNHNGEIKVRDYANIDFKSVLVRENTFG